MSRCDAQVSCSYGSEGRARCLRLPDAVFDPGVLAVPQLQPSHLPWDDAGRGVGEHGGDPVPVHVGEGELGAWVGAFLAQDQPRSLRPGGQVDHAGGLGGPRAVAQPAVVLNGGVPAFAGNQVHDGLDALVDGEPEGGPHPRARQAAANTWVAPAESERASTRGEDGSPGRGRA